MVVKKILEIVPGYLQSPSAVEVFADRIYIAGDNIEWLYQFRTNFYFQTRIRLWQGAPDDVQKKKVKSDWEAMAVILAPAYDPMLLIIASGSRSPQRDKAMLLNLFTNQITPVAHWPAFYDVIRNNIDVELNVEGLAQVKENLVLLNRGNINGGNFIAVTSVLAPWLQPYDVHIIQSSPFDINGVKAGFTGAFYLEVEDRLVYTAAAEFTDNAYDDGMVAGSAIGYFSNFSQRLNEKELVPDEQVTLTPDLGITGKVESLALNRTVGDKYEFFAVTDNDEEPGSLYLLYLQF